MEWVCEREKRILKDLTGSFWEIHFENIFKGKQNFYFLLKKKRKKHEKSEREKSLSRLFFFSVEIIMYTNVFSSQNYSF